jgi:protein-S-isoprenylcysteine O-methyltransferase Ste14
MNSPEPKDGAAVRFPPPLLPLLTILAGVALQRLAPMGFSVAAPGRYWIGGIIVVVSILVFGTWPTILFRRSGQSPIPWEPTPSIVEQGPYRFTRNPMYLMMVIVCVGFAVILSNAWIFVLTPLCAFLLHRVAILPEEAYLERKFGEGYLGYKRRVRRWI